MSQMKSKDAKSEPLGSKVSPKRAQYSQLGIIRELKKGKGEPKMSCSVLRSPNLHVHYTPNVCKLDDRSIAKATDATHIAVRRSLVSGCEFKGYRLCRRLL